LRDEAIDIRFPGRQDRDEVDLGALQWQSDMPRDGRQAKRPRMDSTASQYIDADVHMHEAAVFSFRFDRILAEIKLMVYRVAVAPDRFPWPGNTENWRESVHQCCLTLLNAVQETYCRPLPIGGSVNYSLNVLTLKYHQCLLLLYRPSPAFSQPSADDLRQCFNSASETLRIHAEMSRFGGLTSSWTTAHTVFISGISVLYCLWTSPLVRQETPLDELAELASACLSVLDTLGKVWSLAESARGKFERLYQLTIENWTRNEPEVPAEGTGTEVSIQREQQPLTFDFNDLQWNMDDVPSTGRAKCAFRSRMAHSSQLFAHVI
jgi:hypothetical protein